MDVDREVDREPCCEWCGAELPGHLVDCPLLGPCPICHAPAGQGCVGGHGPLLAQHASRDRPQLSLLDQLAPSRGAAA